MHSHSHLLAVLASCSLLAISSSAVALETNHSRLFKLNSGSHIAEVIKSAVESGADAPSATEAKPDAVKEEAAADATITEDAVIAEDVVESEAEPTTEAEKPVVEEKKVEEKVSEDTITVPEEAVSTLSADAEEDKVESKSAKPTQVEIDKAATKAAIEAAQPAGKSNIIEAEKALATTASKPADGADEHPLQAAKALVHKPDDRLREVLEKAYSANPTLEAQRRYYQSVIEQVPQALSGALPAAEIDYNKGRQRVESTGSSRHYGSTETKSLTVVQPLFRGGSTYANTKEARRNVDAAKARLLQIEQRTLLQTITAYLDVARAEAVYQLSVKNRDVLAKQKKAAKQRFDVGEDTRTDVAQSEARLALAESEVVNRKGQLESAKASFRELVGIEPEDIKKVTSLPDAPHDIESMVQMALKTSPIVTEAASLEQAADYAVDANIGRLLPKVDLRGSMVRQEGAGIFGNTDFDQDQLIVSASLPLYSGGANYSYVRQAKETHEQRRYELLGAEDQVRRQAVSAWEEMQASKASIESNKQAVASARIALDGVRQEQQYGARTTLDVLDAERELFNAEVQQVISERDYAVAAYTILSVLGQLTASNLGLNVTLYDADEAYSDREYQFIGF